MVEYNDNELLYLLSENDEFAFDMLMEKYQPMIISRLHRYHIRQDYWDDYYQECVILLYKCATTYREDISKTFNKYFDRLLQYHIQNLLRKDRQRFYRVVLMSTEEIDSISIQRVEEKNNTKQASDNEKLSKMVTEGATIKEIAESNNVNYYQAYSMIRKAKDKGELSGFKKNLFSSLELNIYNLAKTGYRPREIASLLSIPSSRVYNALKRIRIKQKNMMKKQQD